MLLSLRRGVFFCAVAFAQLCAADEEEGRAVLLLQKKVMPDVDWAVNKPINVTLTVFNKGPGNAYSLVVNDDNWKSDKFRIVSGGNNFTLDFLNAGEQHEHEFTVKPIRKTWHRVRAAKMAFIDGVEGESTIMHMSNTLPDMRISLAKDKLEEYLLMIGRVVTLNNVKTKQGWMYAAGVLVAFLVLKVYMIASKVLQKRRHLRALEDVKKM